MLTCSCDTLGMTKNSSDPNRIPQLESKTQKSQVGQTACVLQIKNSSTSLYLILALVFALT